MVNELEKLQQRVEELTKENEKLRDIIFNLMNYNKISIQLIEGPLQEFKEFNNYFFEMVSKSKVMKGEDSNDENSGEVLCDNK